MTRKISALLFPAALAEIENVMRKGERTHAAEDWRHRSADYHVERAIAHLLHHREGDAAEAHVIHATARLLMAFGINALRETRGRCGAPTPNGPKRKKEQERTWGR